MESHDLSYMEEGMEQHSPESDKETIRAVVSGDKDSFRHLVRAYQNRVFSQIMRSVGDAAIAEELTQDTFIKAYKNLHSFRFEAQFSTWLTRIAINLTNSYFSSKRFKNRQKTVQLDVTDYEKHAANRESDTFDKEAIEKLRIVVAALPEKYRTVLVLCSFEGKSYEQAAGIIGIPVGTVRSRLNKARHLVKDKYFKKS